MHRQLELVRSLGADEVVDYTREDFTKASRVYDLVFDTVGKRGFSRSLRSLKRGGSYVRAGGSGRLPEILGGMLRRMWVSFKSPKRTGSLREDTRRGTSLSMFAID